MFFPLLGAPVISKREQKKIPKRTPNRVFLAFYAFIGVLWQKNPATGRRTFVNLPLLPLLGGALFFGTKKKQKTPKLGFLGPLFRIGCVVEKLPATRRGRVSINAPITFLGRFFNRKEKVKKNPKNDFFGIFFFLMR